MRRLNTLVIAATAAMTLLAFTSGDAAATVLEVEGLTWQESVEINASLETGTSATLARTDGSLANTCTSSTVAGATSSP
ncbi:MAG TPA: hypothetical protein VFZ29_05760, partial [Solirubrobacterales bacterium]